MKNKRNIHLTKGYHDDKLPRNMNFSIIESPRSRRFSPPPV